MSRGGVREGAGRPKAENGQRKQRQVRAYDEEWILIKEFAEIAKTDKERAKRILQTE